MHKAEILSDSLLLISLEQPAPRLAQNQKQHTALQKKRRMWTQLLEVVQAQWHQPGHPGAVPAAPGMSQALREISQGKEMLITKQVHIPKALLAKPCNSAGCARL